MAQVNEQATNITARINVLEPVANIDINYGPYSSVHEAYQTLSGVEAIAQGLTVGILSNGSIQEYWFKDGTEETNLVEKLADQGIQQYSALPDKPKINNKTLEAGNNNFSASDFSAASQTDFTTHTGNTKIHTPITYNGTTTAVTGIKLVGDKLTFTVGANEYSFRLTEWHDIADFYVLYANMRRSSGTLQVFINGAYKAFTELTTEELMTLSANSYGYSVLTNDDKIEVTFRDLGALKMDYHIDSTTLNSDITAIMVLYRTSGNNQPTMDFIAADTVFSGGYLYKTGQTNILTEDLTRSNVNIGDATYTLVGYFQGNGDSLSGNTNIGINFNKA